MKIATLLLRGSLAVNVALLAAFAFKPALLPPAVRDIFGRGAGSSQLSATEREAAQASNRRAIEAAKAKGEADALAHFWSTLESDDLATLVAHLRAAGFSSTVVREIVNARLNTQAAAKMKALVSSAQDTPFWKTQSMNSWNNPKFFEQMNQIYRDRSRRLREVLGDEAFAEGGHDATAAQKRRFGDMSKQKIDLVQRIADDYAEMTSQVRSATQGITLPEDREKLALLEREKHADLAAVLTLEELEAYEMRTSPTANRLSTALTLMDASEAEFRAIYRIQQPFADVLYPTMGTVGSDLMLQRNDALKKIAEQLKVALGDARYADYVRDSNFEFQQLNRIAQRENIPTETAVRVFNLRDGTVQEANRIFNDTAQSSDQKRAALLALAQTVKGQIVTSLGTTAGNDYVKTANWLSVIERGGTLTFGPDGSPTSTRFVSPVQPTPTPPHN